MNSLFVKSVHALKCFFFFFFCRNTRERRRADPGYVEGGVTFPLDEAQGKNT